MTVDDDPDVLRAVERDLRRQYGNRYRSWLADSGANALESVKQLKLRNDPVALFLVDQRMPRMSGVEFLEAALEFYPEAKRALLTAYADTDAAIRAINSVQIDHYLMKPWDPPRNVFMASWTICSTIGRHRSVPRLKEFGSSAIVGRRTSHRFVISSHAIPFRIRWWTWRQMKQPVS